MLGPPNQSARMAEAFGRQAWFGLLLGKAATQLCDLPRRNIAWPFRPARSASLPAGRSQPRGYNPWLAGDNDLLVDVASTRLPGAADFVVVPVIHAMMIRHPLVQQYTLRFLETGAFIRPTAGSRFPWPVDAVAQGPRTGPIRGLSCPPGRAR